MGAERRTVHLLSYYARHYRQEVGSLVQANGARDEGYPFAAAAINVGHMLVKMLVQGLGPEEEALLCAQLRDDDTSGPSIALCSPLFVVLSRVVEDDTGGQGQGDGGGDGDGVARGGGQALRVLEEMFCAAFRLLEQVSVPACCLCARRRVHTPPCTRAGGCLTGRLWVVAHAYSSG